MKQPDTLTLRIPSSKLKRIILSAFCFLLFGTTAYGQNPNCYRITFSDKNDSPYSVERPEEFLSPRAIAKRERFNIPVIEQDLPVNPHYIDSILNFSNEPSQIISKSKWDNSVVIFYPETENCHTIIAEMINNFSFVIDTLPVAYYTLPFISETAIQKETPIHEQISNAIVNSSCNYSYGHSIDNVQLHKGQLLHKAGFCGDGMLICAFDASWKNCNIVLKPLYENGQIWGTRDLLPGVNNIYIGNEDHPYAGTDHGTATLSEMACTIGGVLIGTAPKANYFLIRSENPWSEQLVEEDFWAYAAEISDSLGTDVVSASVAYVTFDYEWQNIYTPENSDGISSIASRAASILAKKGVIVVNGAGNTGHPYSDWHAICRPADAFDILAVGAVNKYGLKAWFSSEGPSADGRVKPDVAALGDGALALYGDGIIKPFSGTSASTPIIAGLSACLWQALPQYSSLELMDLIRQYGNRYNNPNDSIGYGIPNFYQCYLDHSIGVQENEVQTVSVYPNPTTGELRIENGELRMENVEIFDIYGRKVETKFPSNSLEGWQPQADGVVFNISHLPAGIYFVRIQTESGTVTKKVVKY